MNEDRYRRHQGDDQLELFDTPDTGRSRWGSLLLMAAIAVLVVLGLASFASAQEVGRGVICNTEAQMVKLLEAEDFRATMHTVNQEAGTAACGPAMFYYVEASVVSKHTWRGSLVDIMEVTVIAVAHPATGQMVPVRPLVQYFSVPATGQPT